jgi:hypothetical protein
VLSQNEDRAMSEGCDLIDQERWKNLQQGSKALQI